MECFYEGEKMLYIDPESCVDCGACEPECPVEAIFYDEDVPEKWQPYIELNAELSQTTPRVTEKKTPLIS